MAKSKAQKEKALALTLARREAHEARVQAATQRVADEQERAREAQRVIQARMQEAHEAHKKKMIEAQEEAIKNMPEQNREAARKAMQGIRFSGLRAHSAWAGLIASAALAEDSARRQQNPVDTKPPEPKS